MKNKNIISIILSVLFSVVFVAVAVNAATIIGTDISTGGTLTVSGTATSTFAGGLTIGTSQFVVQQNSGNVGIGTTTPLAKLNIYGGNAAFQTISNSATAFQILNAATTSVFTVDTSAASTTISNLTVSTNSDVGTVIKGTWNGTIISPQYGGTGQNFSSNSGLLNFYSGLASTMATSSLGLLTANVAESGNLYYTDDRVNSYIHASTTIPKLYTGNTWTGLQIFSNTGTTTFAGGIQGTYLDITGTSATSTFARGIDLAGGCFAIDGTCVGGSTYTATYPIALTGSVFGMAFGTTTSNTWAGTQTFGTLAGTIDAGDATSFEIPNAAAPTVGVTGQIGLDTTSGQLKVYNGAVQVYKPERFVVFGYATSTAWTGTTTILLAPAYIGETWTGVKCETDAGTLNVSIYDGTNRMNIFNASTTIGTITLSTNNTFTASESRRVDFGTPATSPTKVSCKASYGITAD